MTAEKQRLQDNGFQNFQIKVEEMNLARNDYLHSFLRDPLARFFIKTLHFSAWKGFLFSLGIVLLTYSLHLIIYYFQNGDFAGIGKYAIDYVYDFILVPVTYGFYIWVSAYLPYVTHQLSLHGVTGSLEQKKLSFPHLHRSYLNRHAVFCCALGLMLILLVIHLVLRPHGLWDWSGHGASRLVFSLLKIPFTWLVPWYMVSVIFFKQIIFILYFRKLFSLPDFQINLQHPDRCGGLKIFSDYLLRFTYYLMLCAFGIALLTVRSIRYGSFQRDFLLHGAILVYIPLCLFFFYFPLHPFNMHIKILIGEFSEKIKESPLIPLWAFTPETQRRFLMVMISPFVFFCLLKILVK